MTKTLEENQAFVKAMNEVVKETGRGYIFNDLCRYFDDLNFKPLCLVGRAMAKVGVEGQSFLKLIKSNGSGYNATDAGIVLEFLGYDPIVADAASAAQKIQDGRTIDGTKGTWGKAIGIFNTMLTDTDYSLSTMD